MTKTTNTETFTDNLTFLAHLSTGKPVILSVWRALEFARLLGTGEPAQIGPCTCAPSL